MFVMFLLFPKGIAPVTRKSESFSISADDKLLRSELQMEPLLQMQLPELQRCGFCQFAE